VITTFKKLIMAIVKENGLRYAKLIHVSVENGLTQQSNKVYIMEEQDDGKIKCSYGRVGRELKHTFKQSHEWNKVLQSKLNPRKGYEDVTHLITEKVTTGGATKSVPIKEAKVRELFEDLMSYANKSIKKNYKVTQESVTQAQIDEAQRILNEVASKVKVGVDIKEINDLLIKLYTTIPRQMKDVRDFLLEKADTKNDVEKINDFLANEQDTLDTMAGQVKLLSQQKNTTQDNDTDGEIDLLEQMGLEVTVETDQKSIDLIMNTLIESDDMRQRVKTIYKCINKQTQAIFDKHYGKARFKDRKLFWHGSRNQNWFNIVQTGLMIRPSGVQHTGSMFGDGIYFANKSRKSLGYSSVRGSYWAGGNSDKGFLALYDVYHGKQKHITHHDSSCYSLSKVVLDREGYDSVYAHGGADLRNDEFIIYDGKQCTIAYLIEFR
jgi:poly [ADP-ribose] polymerase